MLTPSTISLVALPLFSRTLQRAGPGAAVRVLAYLALTGVVLSLAAASLVFVLAPSLLAFALGPDYVGATTATRILVWSLPLAAATAPLLAILAAAGRGVETTYIFLVAFVVAIAMHIILDPRFGATGAAVASLAREPAALLAAVLVVWRTGLLRRGTSYGRSESTAKGDIP
jgi:O-antigen/teichoic acid export membrane protein